MVINFAGIKRKTSRTFHYSHRFVFKVCPEAFIRRETFWILPCQAKSFFAVRLQSVSLRISRKIALHIHNPDVEIMCEVIQIYCDVELVWNNLSNYSSSYNLSSSDFCDCLHMLNNSGCRVNRKMVQIQRVCIDSEEFIVHKTIRKMKKPWL